MMSYSDHHVGSGRVAAWGEADREVLEALRAIGREYGDDVHQSGRADYVVRVLENVSYDTGADKIPNYFMIIVTENGIDTEFKVGTGEPTRGGPLTFDKTSYLAIAQRFRDFRQAIADTEK